MASLREVVLQHLTQIRFVFDHEHARHAGSLDRDCDRLTPAA